MNKRLLLVTAMAIGSAFCLAGCAVVVLGAAVGTAVYLGADLEGYLGANMHGAVDAVLAASDDLRLTPVSKTGDFHRAIMVANDRSGQKITITLLSHSANLTRVKIRVGVGGNEAESRKILTAIERRVRKT